MSAEKATDIKTINPRDLAEDEYDEMDDPTRVKHSRQAVRNLKNPADRSEMTREHLITQSKFVAEYIATMDKRAAARAAGYIGRLPGKRADEIFAWPGTWALVDEEIEGYAHEKQVTKQWYLNRLMDALHQAESTEPYKARDVLEILKAIADHTGIGTKAEVDNRLDISIRTFGEGTSGQQDETTDAAKEQSPPAEGN